LLYAIPFQLFRLSLASLKLESPIAAADSHSVTPTVKKKLKSNNSVAASTLRRELDPSSMSLTLASSIATSRNTLVPLTLGCSANAIELLVPTAPAINDAPDLKAHCFDFMSDLLLEHAASTVPLN
jgi:hypothetical protein